MANMITCFRIVISAVMLFFPALSPVFYILYISAGVSDMVDGPVARKTGTAGEIGAKLDTLADIIFVTVCLIKLMPVLHVPVWICIWTSVIAVIKIANAAAGYIRQKEFISVHSTINKVTGGLLFLFPLMIKFTDLKISAVIVCAAATAAAIHEGYLIRTGKKPAV